MRILYVGGGDIYARHELGFIAALTDVGEVDVVAVGITKVYDGLRIVSDNGERLVRMYVPTMLNDVSEYDVIFTTPRKALMEAHKLSRRAGRVPVILRLISIRAAKLRDNLRFGAYEDILLFVPSLLANAAYVGISHCSIAEDHATYSFARRVYWFFANRVYKLYPPYGYVLTEAGHSSVDKQVIDRLKELREPYILGFTSLYGSQLQMKFEAKPHAVVLYRVAKRLRDVPVVLAGSTLDDWKRAFPSMEPPKNLHLIGRGFSDNVLETLYRNAKLVIVPVTNGSISNRLLEALFFSRPVVTSEVVKLIHPELVHGRHVYVSNWDYIIDDVIRVAKNEALLHELASGAKEAYNAFFSTKMNSIFVKLLLNI